MNRIAPDRPVTVDDTTPEVAREGELGRAIEAWNAYHARNGILSDRIRNASREAELAATIDAWNAHWAKHGSVADGYPDEIR
jgi:hypothetical protein